MPPSRAQRQRLSSEQRDAQIEDAEKEDPHDVHEVPVEGHGRDADVIPGRELAAPGAVQDDQQEDQPTENMETVESGHDEKCAGEAVRGQRQAARKSRDELVQLTELESEAQDYGHDPEEKETPPVACPDGIAGEVAGDTAGQQDDRVEER